MTGAHRIDGFNHHYVNFVVIMTIISIISGLRMFAMYIVAGAGIPASKTTLYLGKADAPANH